MGLFFEFISLIKDIYTIEMSFSIPIDSFLQILNVFVEERGFKVSKLILAGLLFWSVVASALPEYSQITGRLVSDNQSRTRRETVTATVTEFREKKAQVQRHIEHQRNWKCVVEPEGSLVPSRQHILDFMDLASEGSLAMVDEKVTLRLELNEGSARDRAEISYYEDGFTIKEITLIYRDVANLDDQAGSSSQLILRSKQTCIPAP
jgi:hypothetical protein